MKTDGSTDKKEDDIQGGKKKGYICNKRTLA